MREEINKEAFWILFDGIMKDKWFIEKDLGIKIFGRVDVGWII